MPEYLEVRKQAGSFLNLCYAPELACEATLQPVRRYGFDAAILFADILLIPDALGQRVWFEEGEGPRLDPISSADGLNAQNVSGHMKPVYETLSLLKEKLPPETALIGFAGSPWTVASYMIAGRGTPDQAPAHKLKNSDPQAFQSIMDAVVDATVTYLAGQAAHGAEVLQLFDSWAGSLAGEDFDRFCILPNRKIIQGLRDRGVATPVIGFPRGANHRYADFAAQAGVQGLGVDQDMSLAKVVKGIPDDMVVQGNLDPLTLIEGKERMYHAVDEILETVRGRAHIFNLGHGVDQHTPPEHVADLVAYIRRKGENDG